MRALTVLVFVAALTFKLATFSITNDDYLHLASAQQVLLGEVPFRDFFDPGEWLFYGTSALAQLLAGRSLLTELVLDAVGLAVGQTLLFALATTLTRSRLLGLAAAAFSVLLAPRPYSYPKILLYAVGVSIAWRYLERQRPADLRWAGVFTAVAFLFRHDHGAVLGISITLAIVLAAWPLGAKATVTRLAEFAGIVVVLLLPWLVFLQLNGGIGAYVRSSLETGDAEYRRTVAPAPPLVFNWRVGVPLPAAIPPRVSVRWAPSVDTADRQRAEDELRLTDGQDKGQRTFEYTLTDASRAHVTVLVRDPRVEDTQGIDRQHLFVTAWRDNPNANAWLYYLTVTLPFAGLLSLIGRLVWRRGVEVTRVLRDSETQRVMVLVATAWLSHLFLLRAKSDVAVADVGVTSALLAVWLLARATAWRGSPLPWIAVRGVVTLWVAAATAVALSATSGGIQTINALRGARPPIRARLADVARSVAPYGDEAARYVHACTTEQDRLLVAAAYVPDMYVRAGRGFAAGRSYFLSFEPSEDALAFSLSRLRRQRVPIVLTNDEELAWFSRTYPSLAAYVMQNYRPAGEAGTYDVLVDTRLMPTRRYEPGDLPCFR